MNSYIRIKKYEFISPGDLSFHAYEFICIRSLFDCILVPGSNPHLDTIFFANFHVTAKKKT
jgi:hypothetical protein